MTVSKLPLRKKIALNLHSKLKRNASKVHKLNYIFWECTLRCNLDCQHCGSDCSKDAHVPDMPILDFLRALDEAKNIVEPNKTMIVLTGGEALVRKDIEELGEALYERGFPWGIVTNGMLLDKQRLVSLTQAGLRAVTVSLDGLEASHNWLRGRKHSYSLAKNAIQLLTQTSGIRYDVVTCVNRKNLNELPELYKILVEMGVKEWRLFSIFPIGRAIEKPDLHLAPSELKQMFEFMKQTRKEKKIKLNYGCEGYLGNYEQEVRDNFFFCHAGINIASVLVDGSISACPSLRSNFVQGNIYNDNFADVWENRYQKYRDRSWTKTNECSDCKHYKFCEGNGMHLRDENTGELLFCHLKRLEEGENS